MKFSNARMQRCYDKLGADFADRGIVNIDHNDQSGLAEYSAAIEKDRQAGFTWDNIVKGLAKDNWSALRKAAALPGQGDSVDLIGMGFGYGLAIRASNNLWGDVTEVPALQPKQAPTWTIIELMNLEEVGVLGHKHPTPLQLASLMKAKGLNLPPIERSNFTANRGLIAAFEAVTKRPYAQNEAGRCGSSLLRWYDWHDAECLPYAHSYASSPTQLATVRSKETEAGICVAPWVTTGHFC